MAMPKILRDIIETKTQSITATSATVSNGSIVVELPVSVDTGSIIKFTSPCACESITNGLVIEGTNYSISDALGNPLASVNGVWKSGAQLSMLLDCVNHIAYLQNGTPTASQIPLSEELATALGLDPDTATVEEALTAMGDGTITIDFIIPASGWVGSTQTITIDEILGADQTGILGLAPSCTDEQEEAAANASISIVSQAKGSITIEADGTIPTIDIPASIILVSPATKSEELPVVTVYVPTNWIEDTDNGNYYQTVNASGVSGTKSVNADIILGNNAEENEALESAWSCIKRITTADGSVTLRTGKVAPEIAFTMQLKEVK